MRLEELTLFELRTLVRVADTQSLREAARQLDLAPANVSKALKRAEEKCGETLLNRSARGMILTPAGLQFYQTAKKLLELSDDLVTSETAPESEKVIGIASTTFINTHLLPRCLSDLSEKFSSYRYRLVDVPRSNLVTDGMKGAYEMAIHVGKINWPKSWTTTKIGRIRSSLYARAGHPLSHKSSLAEVREFPFVIPTYWSGSEFAYGLDLCPLPIARRKKGDEVSTGATALRLLQNSDQVSFLPEILAQEWIDLGLIKEIRVSGWEDVGEDLFLSVEGRSVKQNFRDAVLRELKKRI